jgi:hypothetical protein
MTPFVDILQALAALTVVLTALSHAARRVRERARGLRCRTPRKRTE